MLVRPLIARGLWALSRYRLQSAAPPASGSAVLIGAPHTSNWDFIIMLAISWSHGFSPKWLGKHTLFKFPFGTLMRALGGIPVNRANPAGLVDGVVRRLHAGERFFLVVTPEGTRQRRDLWKSGFYRIAQAANLPLVLGYVDSATRTAVLAPPSTSPAMSPPTWTGYGSSMRASAASGRRTSHRRDCAKSSDSGFADGLNLAAFG